MAAYAALVCVMNIIETIQNHPRPPISFDNDQLQSLTENVTFLQEFLETHSVDDDDLERRIADAAYAAEDVIESHIVNRIEAAIDSDLENALEEFLENHSIDDKGLESRIADAAYAAEDVSESHILNHIEASKTISSSDFYDGLHKVIQDLDLIQRDMPSFAKKTGINDDDDQLLNNDYSLRTPHSSTGQGTAVGLDDVIVEVMNKLIWNQSNRRIIPIVGMGGMGKTTLASNIYVNPVIVQYFDLRSWATISQEYNSKEILLEVLICLNTMGSRENLSVLSEHELGIKLHKSLCGRRYLIVLDDIWSIEAWHKVKTFFPDNNNGSVIMLTTRLLNLAFQLGETCHVMSFLDDDKSWNLFCKSAFGEESCPGELEGIGKKIVENCKGLPLSIVVVGGLLAKSKRTRDYWLYIAVNLNSIVNSEYDKHCLKILHLSYKELPVHLKPCFLYMGVFPEDSVIDVPDLMSLWVAEGFLKPIRGKCLEIVAEEYFNDLLGRNLILVNERGSSGETIKCKVHDLLVDVCVREAQKQKFLFVAGHHNPQDLNTQRRIVVHDGTMTEVIHAWLYHHGTLVRSLTCKDSYMFPKSFNARLLRVWNGANTGPTTCRNHFLENTHGIANCRYISALSIPRSFNPTLPYSIFFLWNLQTLYVKSLPDEVATSEIWKMSQLRHVYLDRLDLLDPPPSGHTTMGVDDFVLGNLQTLTHVKNFKFSENVIKRIPNIKKLGIYYKGIVDWSSYCLNNLVQLINLELLSFTFFNLKHPIPSELLENLSFPLSLKKLKLEGTKFDWGELGTKIGSLPHLQVLKLNSRSFVGEKWETVEGQFRSLKYLEISGLSDLKYWRTESCTHFPCLEHLSLDDLPELKEIPLEIGETLKSIEMVCCTDSAVFSAKEILFEQEGLGNEGLQVKVKIKENNPDVLSLAAPNFQVSIW